MKNKVAVTTSSFARYNSAPLALLKGKNLEVNANSLGRKLDKRETLKLCKDCIGIVAGTELYDRDILEKLHGLKVISRCGAGMENIDLDTAGSLGIKICNTPEAPALAVAELTIGLILSLLRKIPLADRQMRANLWKKRMGGLLSGKKAGIIGFGNIGKSVARLLKSLGADVIFCDPNVTEEDAGGFSRVEFTDLLKKSDIISLHLSYSRENCNLLGKKEFSIIKPQAFLVNTARAGIIDEQCLYAALKQGELAGAAIDVFEQEPYNGCLKELDNVILTPHIGSYAREARAAMELEAVQNLIEGLGSYLD